MKNRGPRGSSKKQKTTARAPSTFRIKKMINSAIGRNLENKRGAGEVQSLTLGTYTATPVSQTSVLVPTLSQGSAEYQRTGSQVTLKRCVLRGYIRPKIANAADGFYSAGEKLWNVRMIIGKPRNFNAVTVQGRAGDLNIGDLNNLLRDGIDNKPFASHNPLSLIRPVNKYYWKVAHDKLYRIGISSNGSGTNQGLKADNNNYPINRFFTIDLTKHFKKKLIYDETSSYPQNDSLYLTLHLCDIAGLATGDTNCVDVTWSLEYEYEDA